MGEKAGDNVAERFPECLDGSQCLGAQKGFEFATSRWGHP